MPITHVYVVSISSLLLVLEILIILSKIVINGLEVRPLMLISIFISGVLRVIGYPYDKVFQNDFFCFPQ